MGDEIPMGVQEFSWIMGLNQISISIVLGVSQVRQHPSGDLRTS
jgi:hypothetical protein